MKRTTITVILLFALLPLSAVPVGISLSTWGASSSVASGEGVHATVGAFIAPARRVEVEAAVVLALTPHLGQDLLGSIFVSYPFAGPLYHRGGEATLYYNGLVGLGYLGGWDERNQRPVHSLALRFIPFTIGGSYYGSRERALAFTLLYDLPSKGWGVSWSLLGFDAYL